MMSCRRARRAILSGVDSELVLERRLALEFHLGGCRACAEYQARARSLENQVRALAQPLPDLRSHESAVAAIQGRIAEAPESGVRAVWALATVAAALLLGAFLGWSWLQRPPPPSGPGGDLALEMSEAPELDPARVTELVRENLLAAFAGVEPVTDAQAHARRFEALSKSILTWPLVRVAETLLGDPDERVAAAAARYLGVRGDRVSIARMEACLQRPEIAPAVLRALGDRGGEAASALRVALADPALVPLALEELGRIGGAGPARVLQEGLRARWTVLEASEREAWLDALCRTGPASVEGLLSLAADFSPDGGSSEILSRLTDVEDGKEELLRVLEQRSARHRADLLVDALEVLQPNEALSWLEDRCGEPRLSLRALACLGNWGHAAAVRSFLRLDELGTIPEEDLLDTFRTFAASHAELLVETVRCFDEDQETLARGYLELLLASGEASAAPALVALTRSAALPFADRAWAALGVAELGKDEHARELLEGLRERPAGGREVQAACLIAAWKILGPDEVRAALENLAPRGARRVEEVLAEVSDRTPGPVALARVSRALIGACASRNPSARPLL